MDSFEKALIALAALTVISGSTFAAYAAQLAEKTNQEAIKAGLVEGFLPGNSRKVWMKPAP